MKKLLTILFLFSVLFSSAQIQQHGTYYASLAASTGDFPCTGNISTWEFNETTGTTAADVTGTNDGTITGLTLNQTGLTNLTPCFYGNANGYVSIPTFNFLSADFTVSMWAKCLTNSSSYHLFNKRANADPYKGFMIYWDSATGKLKAAYDYGTTGGNTISSTVVTNSWHHIVVTRDGGTTTCYIDGVSEDSILNSDVDVDNTNPLKLFSNRIQTARAKAYIDQTAVWNRALTTTEITALYNSGDGYANDCAPTYIGRGGQSTWASNTSATLSTYYPTSPGIIEDDLLIAIVAQKATMSVTTPTGWTCFAAVTNANLSIRGYYYFADGTETGTQSFVTDGTGRNSMTQMFQYRNVDKTTPFIDESVVSVTSGTATPNSSGTPTVALPRIGFVIEANSYAISTDYETTSHTSTEASNDWAIMVYYQSSTYTDYNSSWSTSAYYSKFCRTKLKMK